MRRWIDPTIDECFLFAGYYPIQRGNIVVETVESKGLVHFEITIDVLVSPFRFMGYDHYKAQRSTLDVRI